MNGLTVESLQSLQIMDGTSPYFVCKECGQEYLVFGEYSKGDRFVCDECQGDAVKA